MAFYTDHDEFCCRITSHLVANKFLPDGPVACLDIASLSTDNLRGHRQVHLFNGIGGIPLGFALLLELSVFAPGAAGPRSDACPPSVTLETVEERQNFPYTAHLALVSSCANSRHSGDYQCS